MKLDFLICGSPNDAFFSQIAFFRLGLDALGGQYRDARVVAVFGDERVFPLPHAWQPYFANIDVAWAPIHEFLAHSYTAQSDHRFTLVREDADVAVMCDADVAILRPIDELCAMVRQAPALTGVIAHYHYRWPGRSDRNPDADWPDLAKDILGRDMERPYRYALEGEDARWRAPFYVNYGMLAGTPGLLREFIGRDRQIRPSVAEIFGSWLAPQISLPLTCADLGIPTRALPLRFNFPNDPVADDRYPDELGRIAFLHYLRTRIFDRQRIFTDRESFESFLGLELSGSNRVLQQHVIDITGGRYPFQRPECG